MKNYQKIFTALFLCVCLLATAFAQSGGTYVITQSVIAGGGGQNSSGGTYTIDGTIGQSLAGGALMGAPYSVTSGFWTSPAAVDAGQGLEGDVASRPSGDGTLQANDVNQVKRFLIGLDQPDQSNEFQRADTAPFSTRGDALLQANDVNQAKRYLIGLDPEATAAGPTSAALTAEGPAAKTSVEDGQISSTDTAIAAPRELRVESTSAGVGQAVTINIRVDAFGDESGYSFRLNYDQTKLTVTGTSIGTAGGTRLCNTGVLGRVTCSVDTFPNDQPGSSTNQIGEIAPGNNQLLLTASFTVAANAPSGATPLTLTNISATNDASVGLTITSVNGTLTIIGPTAASVGVSGRVLTADGQGITNVVVTLAAADGTQRIARSSAFGYYRFDEVVTGENYVLSVSSKSYTFNPSTRFITVLDELTDEDFVAEAPE